MMDSQDKILDQEVKQEVSQEVEAPEVVNEEEAQPRRRGRLSEDSLLQAAHCRT